MNLFLMVIGAFDGIVVVMILLYLVKYLLGDDPFGRFLNILAWFVGIGYFIVTLAVLESNINLILGSSIVFGPAAIAITVKLIVYVIGNKGKS